jgi:pimeloyl-ACP methyl ester carboxylesterase
MTSRARSLTDDGFEIVYDDSGDHLPVVWLHGINEDRWSWQTVTQQLAAELRCIRIDFRGHGESSHGGPYDAAALVSGLAAVIEATCITPPVVVGHSLGGIVATIGAATGLTGPVVSIDQPLRLRAFSELVQSLAPRLRDPVTYADALMEEKIGLGMDRVPDPVFGELERKTRTSDQEVVLDIWKPMLDGDSDEISAADTALEQLLREIKVPYLALHGQPVEDGYEQWLQTANPRAAFEYWEGSGHWLHLVDPDRFVRRLKQFLHETLR